VHYTSSMHAKKEFTQEDWAHAMDHRQWTTEEWDSYEESAQRQRLSKLLGR
jgi:hypothetical protein